MTLFLVIILIWWPAPFWALSLPLCGTVVLAILLRKSIVSWFSAIALALTGFLVATLFWLLASESALGAAANAARSALSAFSLLLLAPSFNSLVNRVTIRIPGVRVILLILPQVASYVRAVFDDVLYSHNLEQSQVTLRLAKAGFIHRIIARLKIFFGSFSVLTNEVVSYCLQWQAVIASRGRLPPLRQWYTPASISSVRTALDLIVAFLLIAAWFSFA
jgi:hypothetical protein